MKRTKILVFLVVLTLLSVSLFANGKQGGSAGKGGSYPMAAAEYPKVDVSKRVVINVYEYGDAPQDLGIVNDSINEILERDYNTTLKINMISWGDLGTKYSLLLAGGEDVDLIHSAPWQFYYTEAAKGAFLPITDEYLADYMPKTVETQIPESWAGTRLNGVSYGVPMNQVNPEQKFIAIRGDLRKKWNIPEITDWRSMENYLVTIAKKESPESGIYAMAAGTDNKELMEVWQQQKNVMHGEWGPFAYFYEDGSLPDDNDFFPYFFSADFREYAKRMKYLADNGVWSQDALSVTVSDDDAFANGQGAMIAWNGTVVQYGEDMEENIPGGEAEYIDITPDSVVNAENYNNNMLSIAAASRYPGRAGMVLDLLKNNDSLHYLYVGGIEGKHYINIDNEFREKGPDAERFPWDAFGWAIRKPTLISRDQNPRLTELIDSFMPRIALPPTNGFVFDIEPVKNEVAAINAVRDEYLGAVRLGMVDNVDATIDEWEERTKASGLADVRAEFLKQYNAWKSANK